MKKKNKRIETRIIKKTLPDGREYFYIEQKKPRFFGGYKWVEVRDDGFLNTYATLSGAKADLCWHDGTQSKTEIVLTKIIENE